MAPRGGAIMKDSNQIIGNIKIDRHPAPAVLRPAGERIVPAAPWK